MKSHFGLNKMLFFGIVFVLYLFELSEKPGFWKTAIIHFVRGRGGGGREGGKGGGGSHYVDII